MGFVICMFCVVVGAVCWFVCGAAGCLWFIV